MTNPFKTQKFKAEFQEWNKILEESGHKEIEDFKTNGYPLKCWHSYKWVNDSKLKQSITKTYYEIASDILRSFTFKNELQKKIWELHTSGLSVRKIAFILQVKRKTTVHGIILRIQRESGIKTR